MVTDRRRKQEEHQDLGYLQAGGGAGGDMKIISLCNYCLSQVCMSAVRTKCQLPGIQACVDMETATGIRMGVSVPLAHGVSY